MTTTQVLTIGLMTALKQANPSGYHRATTGNMPFCPISNGLGLKPSTTVIRILIGCPSLFRATAAKRRLACRAPTPFATTALATPVDIIELNDAADGCLSSDSFMVCKV